MCRATAVFPFPPLASLGQGTWHVLDKPESAEPRYSQLTVPLSYSPTNGSERHFEACATTHIPQVQFDRVLFYGYDHRADEFIGLKVGVSGEFNTNFELVFVQEVIKDHFTALFSEPIEKPSVANSHGHCLVPYIRRVRTAATPCIATTLPRLAASCIDLLSPLFFVWRFHLAATLRKARGANSNRRNRTRRPSCSH